MKDKKILVIEDNKLNLKLVRSLLQIGNYNIIEAVDAETGIRLAREKKPDLILMDIQLPGIDGLTATRLIQKDQELKDIPIIALTSYSMEGDEQKAAEAGCHGYITKPIDTRAFLNQLEEWFT
ncbi:MAG: response regulator [Desulfobacterales bacterium]|nr:response regulator [Desulfobacterales bacterium]